MTKSATDNGVPNTKKRPRRKSPRRKPAIRPQEPVSGALAEPIEVEATEVEVLRIDASGANVTAAIAQLELAKEQFAKAQERHNAVCAELQKKAPEGTTLAGFNRDKHTLKFAPTPPSQ